MHVKVYCQGLEGSDWMNEFITKRVEKLARYLNPASAVHVSIRLEKGKYSTNLAIHNQHDYSFRCDGENLYESFSGAIVKATRLLSENRRKVKDKINRKFYSIRRLAA